MKLIDNYNFFLKKKKNNNNNKFHVGNSGNFANFL
jgi:hypothetical protein